MFSDAFDFLLMIMLCNMERTVFMGFYYLFLKKRILKFYLNNSFYYFSVRLFLNACVCVFRKLSKYSKLYCKLEIIM